jgi:hypothetical protein
VEEKRETWTSVFYQHDAFPEGYTAMPKK